MLDAAQTQRTDNISSNEKSVQKPDNLQQGMNLEQQPAKLGEPVRQAPAPSLCPLACTVTSATRHLLQGSERLRPRDERDAFEGLVILALEFQHGGRTSNPAAEHLSARPSARARKNATVRCRQFVQRAK